MPRSRLPETLGEIETLLSIDKARRMLGYRPRHSWRKMVEAQAPAQKRKAKR